MNIEQVTKSNVGSITDADLHNLRNRAVQIYDKTEQGHEAIAKRTVGVKQSIPRDLFFKAYRIIRDRMEKLGITYKRESIDSKLVRKDLRGVDVSELPPIMLKEAAVCLTGAFVADPKHTATVDVWMADGLPVEMEKRMAEAVLNQTNHDVAVVEELIAPAIPVYDLVLMPRGETREANREVFARAKSAAVIKASAYEHVATQIDAGKFEEFSREPVKDSGGVTNIFGVGSDGKAKVQSIRFNSSTYSVEGAKSWLSSHHYKDEVIAASKTKTEVGKFTKIDEEQRIVGGIVYAPDEVDSQGDYTDRDEIWDAMKGYMIETGGVMKIMHKGKKINAPVVEVFQAEVDTVKDGGHIPAGAWYQANYIPEDDDDTWEAIKSGELSGYSMAGNAEVEGDK